MRVPSPVDWFSVIMPEMGDWFRSITTLGMAFTSIVVVTMGLAMVIAPDPAMFSQDTESGPPAASVVAAPGGPPEADGGIPGLGGTLTASGDRSESFTVDHQAADERFGLTGDDGRIFFDGDPLTVVQLNFDGLSFYPEVDQCTITPENISNAIGIGMADLQCHDLEDIRGNGFINLEGSLGFPLDLLVARELPRSGGDIEVDDETWEFDEAMLHAGQMPIIGGDPESKYNMRLVDMVTATDEDSASVLNFTYDHETHILTLANVERDGEAIDLADATCDLGQRELGKVNPRTTVIELSIQCAAVDVPGLGVVSISGVVVIDRFEFPR